MPNRYHSPRPGLKAREEQLASARKDAVPAREAGETMRGAIGGLDARQRVAVAERALERQRRLAQGKYPVR